MNRAEVYGDLFFETIAIRNGEVVLLDFHLNRIKNGCKILQFHSNGIEDRVKQAIQSKLEGAVNARLRLVFSRSGKGFYLPSNNELTIEADIFDLPPTKVSIQSIGIYTENVKSISPISSIKSNGSLVSVLASLYAKDNGFDDAFIMNSEGRICESIASNVFWIKGNCIYSPPLLEGCVAGVMRQFIIQQFETNKLVFEEKVLTKEIVNDADELFLTNSIHPIVSVMRFGEKVFSTKRTDEIRSLILV